MSDLLFLMVMIIPLPYWLLMIFLPRHPYTQRLTTGWAPFAVLGMMYAVMLGSVLATAVITGTGFLTVDLSLRGLGSFMAEPMGTVIVWTHMVTLDLFVGLWIYQEGRRENASVFSTGLILACTLLSGPLGLLIFLIRRAAAYTVADAN